MFKRAKQVLVIGTIAMTGSLVALAGSVYDRTTNGIPVSGTSTYTNKFDNGNLLLKRIWLESAAATNQTVAISRVTSDNTYTQTVGSVAIAAATSGSTASFTASYLKYGDMLKFASTGGIASTGGVAIIEYEVQQH